MDGWMIHGCKIVGVVFFFQRIQEGEFLWIIHSARTAVERMVVEGKQVAPTRSGWNLSALLLLVITDDD